MRTSIVATAMLAVSATSIATPALAQPSGDQTINSATAFPRESTTGWSAAIRHQSDLWDGQGSLVLVSPNGALQTVSKIADNTSIIDADASRQLILTETVAGEGLDDTYLTVWNLNTKRATRIAKPSGHQWSAQQLVRDKLLVSDQNLETGENTIQLRSFNGAEVKSFASYGEDLGSSPDGRFAYQATPTKVYERNLRTGAVRGADSPRAVRYSASCSYSGMWGKAEIAVNCIDDPGTGRGRSFAMAKAGGATRMLSPESTGAAMPTTPKTINVPSGGFEDGQRVLVAKGGGSFDTAELGSASRVIGAVGGSAYVFNDPDNGNADDDLWFGRYDLGTKKLTKLAGKGSPSGGVVTSVITLDGNR